jgi:hypothetical protein
MPIETKGGHVFAANFKAAEQRLGAGDKKDPGAYTAGALDRIAGPAWRKDALAKQAQHRMLRRKIRYQNKER